MRMYDVISKKKNGMELTKDEIDFFVNGFTKGEIPDYQAAALIMAIFINKMNKRETTDLTMAMASSGDMLDLSKIDGFKVDKHSTGGVGDKTTIALAPLVASAGVPVAKMSGRGLGHTGGTIDKLESIDGFSVNISMEEFISNVNKIKIALAAQTGCLAPADKKIYALRDVTATVDNMSLIASSIMSKKIASGADGIVLDVKVGEGAFMKTKEDAKKLAKFMVQIGKSVDKKIIAVLSDMNQPLGYAVGNSLEVIEAINTLKGNGPKDLLDLTLCLGSNMLLISGKVNSFEEGKNLLMENIKNGKALEKLKEFIKLQGGNENFVDNTALFKKASYKLEVKSKKCGYITKIHAEKVGLTAMKLGAGRENKDSKIDLSVGIVLSKKCGDYVNIGDPLAMIHANDINKGQVAVEELLSEIEIGDKINQNPLVYEIIK